MPPGEMKGAPATAKLTTTVCDAFSGLAAAAGVTTIVPKYVPGASPAEFAVTVSVAGAVPAVPVVGVTDSQFAPDSVEDVTEKLMLPEPRLITPKLPVTGAMFTDASEAIVKEDGATLRIGSGFTVNVTVTDCVLLLEVKTTVPV
jgi:hypothetical protein